MKKVLVTAWREFDKKIDVAALRIERAARGRPENFQPTYVVMPAKLSNPVAVLLDHIFHTGPQLQMMPRARGQAKQAAVQACPRLFFAGQGHLFPILLQGGRKS